MALVFLCHGRTADALHWYGQSDDITTRVRGRARARYTGCRAACLWARVNRESLNKNDCALSFTCSLFMVVTMRLMSCRISILTRKVTIARQLAPRAEHHHGTRLRARTALILCAVCSDTRNHTETFIRERRRGPCAVGVGAMVYQYKEALGRLLGRIDAAKTEQGNPGAHGRAVATGTHECIGGGEHSVPGGCVVRRAWHTDLRDGPGVCVCFAVAQDGDMSGRGLDVGEMFHWDNRKMSKRQTGICVHTVRQETK